MNTPWNNMMNTPWNNTDALPSPHPLFARPTLLELAADAEVSAREVDAQIARHFGWSAAFVTRQRECNPLWHEQLEVRWRTETFPPLAARREPEERARQQRRRVRALKRAVRNGHLPCPCSTSRPCSHLLTCSCSQLMAELKTEHGLSDQDVLDGIERVLEEMYPPVPAEESSLTWSESLIRLFCRDEVALGVILFAFAVLILRRFLP